MQIPDSFISELVLRTDIVDTVSQYMDLKRRGSSYKGLCPFHGEKTPSFTVSAEKQLFHCFGCGAGGDVISFVMRAESIDFIEAVKLLAGRAGMQAPEIDDGGASAAKGRVLELNRAAARWFHECLKTDTGANARKYVIERGLDPRTVKRFGIGYAPAGWDGVIKAMSALGFTKQELLDAGLALTGSKKDGFYDRFRNRLMFPIIDLREQVIAFGGRALDGSGAKYLNSPETMVFSKSRNLYALNFAKKSKRRAVLLAEGYMDVVSLHQAGVDFAVASLGTALTETQAALIKKYADKVYLAYDSDSAGRTAAERAIGILAKHDLSVRVIRLDGAKDPDEYIRRFGPDAFEKALEACESHIEYKLTDIAAKFDMKEAEQRLSYIKEAVAVLAGLDSLAEASVYSAKAAEIAGVDANVVDIEVKRERALLLRNEDKKTRRRELSPVKNFSPQTREVKYSDFRSARAEEELIALISSEPSAMAQAEDLEQGDFTSDLLGRLYSSFQRQYELGLPVTLGGLAGEFSASEMSHISAILSRPHNIGNVADQIRQYTEAIKLESTMRNARQSDTDESVQLITEEMSRKKGGGGTQ